MTLVHTKKKKKKKKKLKKNKKKKKKKDTKTKGVLKYVYIKERKYLCLPSFSKFKKKELPNSNSLEKRHERK